MEQQVTQSQLSAARQAVFERRSEIASIAAQRHKLLDEANSLVGDLKAGSSRAHKTVAKLDAQINDMQAEENRLNNLLAQDLIALQTAENNSLHAQQVLRLAQHNAAEWAPVAAQLRALLDGLEPVRVHILRHQGGYDINGRRAGGSFTQADVDAANRLAGLLSRGLESVVALEQARAYAELRGLPADDDG